MLMPRRALVRHVLLAIASWSVTSITIGSVALAAVEPEPPTAETAATAQRGAQPRPPAVELVEVVEVVKDRRFGETAHAGPAARAVVAGVEEPKTPRPRREPKPKGPFAVCPVDRPREYIDSFGHARYSGGFHRHEGIDIMAPSGTPVRAPFAGTTRVSTNWAGGLAVEVHGPEGFVYNAHLSRLGTLGKVKAGTVIGFVGNSGNATGGSPHDHFEWHPGGGAAVNPFELLNAVC